VVEVEDRITEVRDVQRRLAPAFATLRDRALDLVDWLPLAGVALVALLVFWVLGKWVGGRDQPFRRLAGNRFLADLLRHVARAAVVVVGAVLALEILDATALVGAVLGAAGLVGLAIGFAFRDTAENYIASVLLSVRQPFAPNDLVEIEGREGRVVRLTSRATVLMTLDGNHVRIPNAVVFKGVLTNFTRNPRRRFDFTVGVGTDVDLVAALGLGRDILVAMEGVLDEPPPQAWIDALGDSSVTLHFFGWVDQRANEFAKVKSEAIRLVKEAFDAAGYDMPEPIYRLRIAGEPAALPAALPAGPPAGETETVPTGEPAPRGPKKPAHVERERPPIAPPGPEHPAPAAAEPRVELDISRDTHLDREVAADRADSTGADLLDPAAPQE
jgi:small-conductance mechanosensitive channel